MKSNNLRWTRPLSGRKKFLICTDFKIILSLQRNFAVASKKFYSAKLQTGKLVADYIFSSKQLKRNYRNNDLFIVV